MTVGNASGAAAPAATPDTGFPVWRRQVGAMLRLELRKTFLRFRALPVISVAFLPPFMLFMRVVANRLGGARTLQATEMATQFAALYQLFFVRLVIFFVCFTVFTYLVRGEIAVPDTVHWRGVRGSIAVKGDALITGEAMRDVLMHQVMQTSSFPEIVFTVDSLTNSRQDRDTLRATAVGSLTVRGIVTPTTAQVRAFHDAGGMRVLAKFRMPATALLELTPRIHGLGLGVSTNIWHDLFMGTDMVLRPEGSKPASQGSD